MSAASSVPVAPSLERSDRMHRPGWGAGGGGPRPGGGAAGSTWKVEGEAAGVEAGGRGRADAELIAQQLEEVPICPGIAEPISLSGVIAASAELQQRGGRAGPAGLAAGPQGQRLRVGVLVSPEKHLQAPQGRPLPPQADPLRGWRAAMVGRQLRKPGPP